MNMKNKTGYNCVIRAAGNKIDSVYPYHTIQGNSLIASVSSILQTITALFLTALIAASVPFFPGFLPVSTTINRTKSLRVQ